MRVLIAEDEPLEAEALRRRLEGLGHTVVDVVYEGAAAVQRAEDLRPELIFLDLRMPRLDGIAAAAKITAQRHVPIVLLTGQADPALLEAADRAGVAGHLVKPVDHREIAAGIVRALARHAARVGQTETPPSMP